MSRRVPADILGSFYVGLARPELLVDVDHLVRRLWAKGREEALRAALVVLQSARSSLDEHRADWRTRAKDDAVRVAAHRRGEPLVTWREVTIGERSVRVGRARHDHEHWRGAPVPIGPGNPERRIRTEARRALREAGLSVRAVELLVRAYLR